MSIYKSEDIKRYEDGSIDYIYYASKGQIARNKEITAVIKKLWNIFKIVKKRLTAGKTLSSNNVTKLNNLSVRASFSKESFSASNSYAQFYSK